MSTLFRNLYEYSRVIETVTLTEEGIFVKDRIPDDYGGSTMNVEVVHHITMVDSAGHLDIFYFENPVPKSKDRSLISGPVFLDGKSIVTGPGDQRDWTTRKNPNLTAGIKAAAEVFLVLVQSDKEANGGLVL